jgi:hypothetical protein
MKPVHDRERKSGVNSVKKERGVWTWQHSILAQIG